MKRSSEPRTIDDYLALLSDENRGALEHLRKAIKSAAPKAEEHGRLLVGFGAAARHCSFYPGAHPIAAHKKELEAYSISKGTIRFDPAEPLPAALVRKLVRTRIAEYGAKRRRDRGAAADHGGNPRRAVRPAPSTP